MESHRCKETRVSSRWNPTKEQISILENLYEQGVRTPSADQIQDITAILSAYSHIEGKNVFYWFQNHKARSRQKHQQETLAYFNRFLYSSRPIFSYPLGPNVICCPYHLPQNEISFYPQHSENYDDPQGWEHTQIPENLKTLTLFPLRPTGILEGKTRASLSSSASITAPSDDSSDVDEDHGQPGNQPVFEFFPLVQGSQT